MIGAGVAWACNPQAYVASLNPSTGPGGTVSSISGSGFVPAEEEGTIEVRWDSASGPLLAETAAPGGSFTAPITIPRAATTGTHSIVALGRASDGSVAGSGSIGFLVTAPPPPKQLEVPSPGPPSAGTPPFDLESAVSRCKRVFKDRRAAKKRKRCIRRATETAAESHRVLVYIRLF